MKPKILHEDKWQAKLIIRKHIVQPQLLVIYSTPQPVEVTVADLEQIIIALACFLKLETNSKIKISLEEIVK